MRRISSNIGSKCYFSKVLFLDFCVQCNNKVYIDQSGSLWCSRSSQAGPNIGLFGCISQTFCINIIQGAFHVFWFAIQFVVQWGDQINIYLCDKWEKFIFSV